MKSEKSDSGRPPWIRSAASDSKHTERSTKTTIPSQNSGPPEIVADLFAPPRSHKSAALNLTNLAKALHMPPNKQTLTALGYALHFGIPLQKETIEPVLKQIMRIPSQQQDAGLLTTLLALSKGLQLSDSAVLRLVSILFMPDQPRIKTEQENLKDKETPGRPQGSTGTDKDEQATETIPSDAPQTALLFSSIQKKYPLLDLLNRLPNKHKQRYILLPFHLTENKLEIQGNLRLFCIDRPGSYSDVQQLTLEARSNHHDWYVHVVKNKAGGLQTTLQIYPPIKNTQPLIDIMKSFSDSVTIGFEKVEPFQDYKENSYTTFEITI